MVNFSEVHSQRILLSPLNWGLGHVSRCIGLIDKLRKRNNEVIVACDVQQKSVFLQYYDDLEFVPHDGYPFKFRGGGNFAKDLFVSRKALNSRLKDELFETDNLVKKHSIDLVISDHRYGFRSDKVNSIFVTHQMQLPVKWFQRSVQRLHRNLIAKYDGIWVLDYPDSSLAGDLSRGGMKESYIGPCSRFERYSIPDTVIGSVAIISGPDVYAQQLVEEVYAKFGKEVRYILPMGLQLPMGIESIRGDWLSQDRAILNSETIISRSGYSTIMDNAVLGKKLILIPTPGQAEQVYLAKMHG